MGSSMSMDCYGTSNISSYSAQAVPQLDDDPVNSKLAYRYFLKGHHAFSAGDLNRATLMFQCALDANPADQKVRSFLKRAVELKTLSAEDTKINRHRLHTQYPQSMLASQDSEPVDMAPLLRHNFPKRTNTYAEEKVPSSISKIDSSVPKIGSDRIDNLVRPDFGSTSREDTALPLWENIPSSPAELLDSAPSNDKWNDILASVAAIIGVLVFGLVLTM